MLVEVDLPIPDGWELAENKTRLPKIGEMYLSVYGDVCYCTSETVFPYWILRRNHKLKDENNAATLEKDR